MPGRRVAQLADGVKSAGSHEAVFDAAELSSGLSICHITAAGTTGVAFLNVQKMLLTK